MWADSGPLAMLTHLGRGPRVRGITRLSPARSSPTIPRKSNTSMPLRDAPRNPYTGRRGGRVCPCCRVYGPTALVYARYTVYSLVRRLAYMSGAPESIKGYHHVSTSGGSAAETRLKSASWG